MEITDAKELRKIFVLNSVLDVLVLQSLKEESLTEEKIVEKINSKFNVSLDEGSISSVLSFLQKEKFVLNNSEAILTLTEKGELMRQKLVKDHITLQKILIPTFKLGS